MTHAGKDRSVATPDIYICVRSTLDWSNEARVQQGLKPDFRPKVDAWNATFDLPYHAFRHRLKQIAQISLGQVEHAPCAPTDEIPPQAIVVPVDDDDWLAPDLAQRIRAQYDAAAIGYHWSLWLIELPRRATLRSWLTRWRRPPLDCGTNNYAIVNLPELRPLVSSHMRATEHFNGHPSEIVRLSQRLSIQNRNMASQTAMGWRQPSITRDQLLGNYRRYRTLYESLVLPADCAWARPYVRAMAELMQEIRIR